MPNYDETWGKKKKETKEKTKKTKKSQKNKKGNKTKKKKKKKQSGSGKLIHISLEIGACARRDGWGEED